MTSNLDEELKMAQIKHLEQMVAESQAVVEQMREDFRIAEMERERQRRIDEEERKVREEERKVREEERKERALERDAYIAKMRAETQKYENDSKYLIWIPVIVSIISSLTALFIAFFK